MRTIWLYFEIYEIIHWKRYRFFDIGNDHYCYDDYANETGMNEVCLLYTSNGLALVDGILSGSLSSNL